jgi:hypothetical protein
MDTKSFQYLIFGAAVAFCLATGPVVCATDTVRVWYGNVDGSPIWAFPGYPTRVDVWIQTGRNLSVTQLHLCLGVLDQYIDSLIIVNDTTEDCIYSRWDSAYIPMTNFHAPPNNPGWSSQSFIGTADTGGSPNYPINTSYPKRFLTFFIKPQNNPNYIGDTISCLGAGQNPIYGSSWAGGVSGQLPLQERYSPLNFTTLPGTCIYVIDTSYIYGIVTIMAVLLKGGWVPPPFGNYCSHPSLPGDHLIRAMFDYNGDCRFSGADVAYVVGYYKGRICKLYDCPLTPYKIYYNR